jgi:hypothetical protein
MGGEIQGSTLDPHLLSGHLQDDDDEKSKDTDASLCSEADLSSN